MKTTGMICKIDDLGRIVIPKALRRNLHLREEQHMEICINGDSIVLIPCRLQCVFCGCKDEDHLINQNDVLVCPDCVNKLSGSEVVE